MFPIPAIPRRTPKVVASSCGETLELDLYGVCAGGQVDHVETVYGVKGAGSRRAPLGDVDNAELSDRHTAIDPNLYVCAPICYRVFDQTPVQNECRTVRVARKGHGNTGGYRIGRGGRDL